MTQTGQPAENTNSAEPIWKRSPITWKAADLNGPNLAAGELIVHDGNLSYPRRASWPLTALPGEREFRRSCATQPPTV